MAVSNPHRRSSARLTHIAALLLAAIAGFPARCQEPARASSPEPATPVQTPSAASPSPAAANTFSGTIRGSIKAGVTPLPGVAVTATNTLTGKKYATTTDLNGAYEISIPRTGRYVVRAELAAFAPVTSEVRLTGDAPAQAAPFALELASRAAATDAAAASTQGRLGELATSLMRGTQSLNVSGDSSLADASPGAGASLPSLGGLGGADNASSADSVAISGQVGQTNALAGLNEDDVRQRIEEAMSQARAQGGAAGDQMNAVVGMLGGLLGGGGFGGGGRGGRGGGGAFRGFNPAQPHGAVFYQGSFSALNAQQFSLTGAPTPRQSSYQNRFGVSFAGSPSLPGLAKADPKQFVFFNVTGARNINPLNLYGVVPTDLERAGNFSGTLQRVNGTLQPVAVFNPATGQPFANNQITGITPQALQLLRYYPEPNTTLTAAHGYNYQTITTQGQNTTNASARYVRNLGAAAGLGGFGGSRQSNTLRQNINAALSYSHSAEDLRNIIPLLGGKSSSDGYGLTAGYTVGRGRLNNNASLNWNRSHALTTNYFTGAPFSPAADAGVNIPNQNAQLPRPGFYNGVPNIQLTNYTSLAEQTPREAINQTISFSDFVSYSHKKHNLRFGLDLRRVHADQLGGNNVEGSFVFSGLVTESPNDRNNTIGTTEQARTGSSLADFLLGQPQETKIQAGLFKTYLRETVYDFFAQDDFRVKPGITLNYGVRYEYFGPYSEKNNRLSNLDHNADFTVVDPVLPSGRGQFLGAFPRSLVNPDHLLISPRFGVAWRPSFVERTVVRAGYGVNYNTGQYASFAQSLAFQPPFALTQNNVLSTPANQTGCNLSAPGAPTNLTLANGFGQCTTKPVTNTFAVNKDYRLGHVQVYNLDVQHSFPHGIVLNIGYNGSRGGNLDIVRAPNATATTVTSPSAQAFTYEDSLAESRLNQVVVSARKRLEKGISMQAVYQYGHSIDNASSIGGGAVSEVQNDRRLDLEESNSSFDARHRVSGNFILELPFGPNRRFLSKGGAASKILDGFALSGDFGFSSGLYFTPRYINTAAQLAAGGTYTLRPDRVFSQPISGPGSRLEWFNPAAFVAPANGFGTASRNSIEGPGTVNVNMSFGRSVALGSTRNFEARMTATNVFNTVQYSSIDTVVNSATFGQVTGTAGQRRLSLLARYRF